jgi:hypothetical protein
MKMNDSIIYAGFSALATKNVTIGGSLIKAIYNQINFTEDKEQGGFGPVVTASIMVKSSQIASDKRSLVGEPVIVDSKEYMIASIVYGDFLTTIFLGDYDKS